MTVTPIRKRTAAALNAGHAATAASLDRARAALQQMKHEHAKITVAAVARRADASRTFLYQNAATRQLITESVAGERARRTQARSAHAARIEASWRERALNAEDGLNAAHHEILTQRSTIGELVGKIRDLEADLPEDGVRRLITENTTLKHRIRELTQEVKRFQERLRAARDNNRFLDNKIADLEARLVNPTNVFEPSPASPATADRYSATTAAASTPSRSSNSSTCYTLFST